MNACIRCNGYGIVGIRNGDDDQPCPLCNDLSPAPISVAKGSYVATVTPQDGLYHLSMTFFGGLETLTNCWCSDHHSAIALGQALKMACYSDKPAKHIGYNWAVGQITFTGWIEFRGRTFDKLPSVVTQQAGYELGVALVQLGETMRLRREVTVWLNQIATPQSRVG